MGTGLYRALRDNKGGTSIWFLKRQQGPYDDENYNYKW